MSKKPNFYPELELFFVLKFTILLIKFSLLLNSNRSLVVSGPGYWSVFTDNGECILKQSDHLMYGFPSWRHNKLEINIAKVKMGCKCKDAYQCINCSEYC